MTYCLVCPAGRDRIPHRGLVCEACRSWLAAVLTELPGYVDELLVRELVLDAAPLRGLSAKDRVSRDVVADELPAASIAPNRGSRVSGTRERSTPISLNVVDLTAKPRYGAVHDEFGDQIGETAVLTVLDVWVRDIREHRAAAGRSEGLPLLSVRRLVDWLTARLDDTCDTFGPVVDMAADLRHLRGVLCAHLGLGGPDFTMKDGIPCPNPKCESIELFQRAGSDRVECGACPNLLTLDEYDRWIRLRAANLVHLRGSFCAACRRENVYRLKGTAMPLCGWCETRRLVELPPPNQTGTGAQYADVGRAAA